MTKRIRHHVNPLSERYLHFTPDKTPLNSEVIEVELGCAEGDFLFRRYSQHPDHLIIGIEIRKDHVENINKTANKLNITNIKALFANLNIHIPEIFPNESVDRFFINFPDPWFKKSHHKRRVLTPELLDELITALKPNGEILFQSDIFDLAIDGMSVLEEFGFPRIKNVLGEWTFMPKNPFNVPTRREKFVSEEGKKVWRMLYLKSHSL